ncbi:MAG: YhdT family protein [Spirochaetaceae bacterium]|nr:YhdT family protein [Spirochaetaceae bacterium]
MTYREKFVQMNREAAATGVAVALVAAFWWISGFALEKINFTLFSMPGWFVVSCVGSLILSACAALFLVKKVYKNFSLQDDEDGETESVAETS